MPYACSLVWGVRVFVFRDDVELLSVVKLDTQKKLIVRTWEVISGFAGHSLPYVYLTGSGSRPLLQVSAVY